MVNIESQILSNLINNEEYARKVIPHLKTEYFSERKDAVISKIVSNFYDTYNRSLSQEILQIEISNYKGITDKEVSDFVEYANTLTNKEPNTDWLIAETENFCKQRAVYLAILDSIKIIDGKDNRYTQDAIPSILSDALSVSFDDSVGHDYISDAESRYEFYHRTEEKIPFGLELMDLITKGGVNKKTLTVITASTGGGKSLFKTHHAASCLLSGKNVLYITLEMAEEKIAERIDANLLNLTMDELKTIDKDAYLGRIGKLTKKTQGKLVIKEYPTSSAHAGHFRALLEELRIKKNFVPDIIYIDYLNICASQRLKNGGAVNSYTYVKAIAEEIRGLAIEYNVPIISSTQLTRSGQASSDPNMEDISESIGLSYTVDLMFAMIGNEELNSLNQVMIKQLKNRYNDLNYYKKFMLGIDRSKMKLYDLEKSAQANIADSGQPKQDVPLFDKSSFGSRVKEESFNGFKF